MYDWNYFENITEYHPIADGNNLYNGFQRSREGSAWKASVQLFRWNILDEIRKLQVELDHLYRGEDDGYKLSNYSCFTVNERGKTRAITALDVRDRVVKHSLNDNYLLPHIRPYLIYDNGASLKGKGVSFTRKRLIAHLKKYYKEVGSNDGYIMTMDFSGFYDNIDHNEAMKVIEKYEPDDFARLLTQQAFNSYKIDVSYMTDSEFEKAKESKFSMVDYRQQNYSIEELTGEKYLDKSLSVGDQTSQITAVAFPTQIDNLIKIVNGIRYYGRYMDDLYVIARTIEELKDILYKIEDTARQLKIIINPRKTKITRLNHTFKFMQFKYYLRENGYVVVRINPKTLKRMRKKLKSLAKLVGNGKTNFKKVESMFMSWMGNFKTYMSRQQAENIINLYRDLFGNDLDSWLKKHHLPVKFL